MSAVPAAARFLLSAPVYASSGTAFSSSLTALDTWNNTVTGYSGTVHFTSSDGLADLPADSAVTSGNGTAVFGFTLNTVGMQTVTATDTVTSITGTSRSINVIPAGTLLITSGQPPNGTVGRIYGTDYSVCDTPPND